MKRTMAGIALGTVVTMLNVGNVVAAPMRADTVNCDAGYHWYSICPNYNYCAQGGVETCWQICPNQRDNENTTSDHCDTFGSCESVGCTF
jgi:hypothetical protein